MITDMTHTIKILGRDFNKAKVFKAITLVAILILVVAYVPSFAQDPSGANTGNINDVTAATAGKPTLEEVGTQAGHNKIAINIMKCINE